MRSEIDTWYEELKSKWIFEKVLIIFSLVLKGAQGSTGKPGPVGKRGKPASIQL